MDGWITQDASMQQDEEIVPDLLGQLLGEDDVQVFDELLAVLADDEDTEVLAL
jgi:hypothetical protein